MPIEHQQLSCFTFAAMIFISWMHSIKLTTSACTSSCSGWIFCRPDHSWPAEASSISDFQNPYKYFCMFHGVFHALPLARHAPPCRSSYVPCRPVLVSRNIMHITSLRRKIVIYNSGIKLHQKVAGQKSCTIPERNQVRVETVNSAFRGRHDVPLCSPSRHQKSDPHSSPRNSADL